MRPSATPGARWDIFCRVVDNFGDAGVCWRLARVLAAEHRIDVTLWIDAVGALARLAPAIDATADDQACAGVRIRAWRAPFAADVAPAAVVVEAFGGGLPDPYVDAMTRAAAPPRWFVLEYLSAEDWVDGTHAMPSPHPRLPLVRRFWFPGFTRATGGLLREAGLVAARDAFRADAAAQAALWTRLGAPPPAAGELRASLFCYPQAPLAPLLDAWAQGSRAVTCVVPTGVAPAALAAWLGAAAPAPGAALARGRLTVRGVPFVAQDDYDRLLWACDVNFVRGEDSFVRAQWAGRPFVWHIYAQDADAHRAKLDAFLARYTADLSPRAAAATSDFWRAWNGGADALALEVAWAAFDAALPELAPHGRRWAAALAALPELATGLVKAARNGL
jgi:uncharacterized repeat protein (TIGR03837 family)